MKSFKQLLESLNPQQKSKMGIYHYDEPRPAAVDLSKHIIPEDKRHIDIPITQNTKQQVLDHLEKHGYDREHADKFYDSGFTKDKHDRAVSIGSVLKNPKTSAPERLAKDFDNDSRKFNPTNDTHRIILSRDPEHVAECSTNKGWSSCAKLTPSGNPTSYGGGQAAKEIPNHIKVGTHVAYLLNKKKSGETTPDMNDAEARVLLHPYHTYDSEGEVTHSVLMPEKTPYAKQGRRFSNFTRSVEDFARKNFKMQPGKVYHKDSTVYDDDKDTTRFDTSPESVKKIMMGTREDNVGIRDKQKAVSSAKLNHKTIKHILDMPSNDTNFIHGLLAEHQKLNDENFNHLYDNGHITALSKNKTLNKKQVDKLIYHKHQSEGINREYQGLERNETIHGNIVENHSYKLNDKHIHHILDNHLQKENLATDTGLLSPSRQSHGNFIRKLTKLRDKMKPEHFEKMNKSLSNGNDDIFKDHTKRYIKSNLKYHGQILNDIALSDFANSTRDVDLHNQILSQPNAGEMTKHEVALKTEHPELRQSLIKGMTSRQLNSLAISTIDPEVHKEISKHDDADEFALQHIARRTKDHEVQNNILNHKNVNNEAKLQVAANTSDPDIRKRAIKEADSGFVYMAGLNDDTDREISKHKNADSYVLKQIARNTQDPEIQNNVLNHKNTNTDAILREIARNTDDPKLHRKILNHPNVDHESKYEIAKKSKDKDIRHDAMKDMSSSTLNRLGRDNHDPEVHHEILNHPNSDDFTKEYMKRRLAID